MALDNTNVFFSSLIATQKSIDAVRQSYNPELAFEFNALSFFNLNENKNSEILAYFLNPHAGHGQGKLFLELFLKSLNQVKVLKLLQSKDAKVRVEEYTSEYRKIDVYIEIGDCDFCIGIENKIYETTQDQDKQLEHYSDELNRWSDGKYTLYYLAPKEKEVGEHSLQKEKREVLEALGNFKAINYSDDIIPLIREWHIHCRAQRVKSFLQDLEQYFKNQYTGEKFMSTVDSLIEQSVKGENAEVTLTLLQNTERIYNKMLEKLNVELRDYAKYNNIEFLWEVSREKKYSGFRFWSPETEKLKLDLLFEFGKNYNQDLYFGFVFNQSMPNRTVDFDRIIKLDTYKSLVNAFNGKYNSKEKPGNGWLCWTYFAPTNWHAEAFKEIANGRMISKIVKEVDTSLSLLKD